ncbi:MAG: DNA methyltransferase [Phycisphaerae bacterium]
MSKNRANNLSGKEWLQYSFSIWRDIKKENGERQIKHPAMFPILLPSRIIDIFTKRYDVVLDPFMGIGSTVLAAYQNQRLSIGFELSKDFVKIAKNRINEMKGIFHVDEKLEPKIFNKDSRLIDREIAAETVDLCVTSPPYWDILNMKRTADRKNTVSYSSSNTDIGNIVNYNTFLDELKSIFSKVYRVLKYNGHCVVVVMDIRKKDKFYPFHSDVATFMKEIGFSFEDILIWDRQHEYNNMRPLGYPYVFRVNKVHEYILIFKKLK